MDFIKKVFMMFLLVTACSHLPVAQSKPQKVAWVKLEGEIDRDSATLFALQVAEVMKKNPDVLLVEIDSPGGSISHGQTIQKILQKSPIPVVCVVDNEGMSMAFIILESSCTRRVMTKRSLLMMHKPSIHMPEPVPPEVKKEMNDYINKLTVAVVDDMVVNMKVTSEYVMEKINAGNWFMGWKEALDIGAVDRVVYRTEDVLKDPLREY